MGDGNLSLPEEEEGFTSAVHPTFQDHRPTWVELLLMVLVTCLILLASAFTLSVILSSSGHRSAQGIFMICIAGANLAVGTCVTPVSVFLSLGPASGDCAETRSVCNASGLMLTWSVAFILYSIGYMAAEKLLKITRAMRHPRIARRSTSLALALATFLFCGIFAAYPVLAGNSYCFYIGTYLCGISDRSHIILFGPAILLNIAAQAAIFFAARRLHRKSRSMCPSGGGSRDLRAARTISISLAVFFLSYLPSFLLMVVRHILGKASVPRLAFMITSWVAISNNFFGSILYYHHNAVFRSRARKLVRRVLSSFRGPLSDHSRFDGLWTVTDIDNNNRCL